MDVTKHHRKPLSIGGKDVPSNISYVPRYQHEAWHVLFDNYDVMKTLCVFQQYYEVFGPERSPFQVRRDREWVRKSRYWTNKKQAWGTLFRGKSLQEIVHQINQTWIDPMYELVIVPYNKMKTTLGVR